MDRVYLFDTTLRDGEQSPGATMSPEDRLHIAHLLAQAGVDIIEAGFPAASPIVAKSVAEIARSVRGSQVAALARCTTGDIDIAWESIKEAESPRLHVFIATSDIHIERKLRTTREDVVQRVAANVAYAKSKCNNIEFSAEDATRSDSAFLFEVYATAIRAGATTINVPDTVGYTTPAEMADLVERIIREVPGIENVIVSVHTHDDLGLATANALSAVGAGARQVECTINGIGERAGNCALEEVAVAMTTRRDRFKVRTGFRSDRIAELSAEVSRATDMPVQKNKAIVGANAFAHESGIHQDGMIKDRRTYEIVDPSTVGAATRLPLSRNSGRNALLTRISDLGIIFGAEGSARFEEAFRKFVETRRNATDDDLLAIAHAITTEASDAFALR
jgi:2-isopropylmalate synthase